MFCLPYVAILREFIEYRNGDVSFLCDSNPHLIDFYSGIASGEITPEVVKEYLTREGEILLSKGEDHYYFVRDRFNSERSPLDFFVC